MTKPYVDFNWAIAGSADTPQEQVVNTIVSKLIQLCELSVAAEEMPDIMCQILTCQSCLHNLKGHIGEADFTHYFSLADVELEKLDGLLETGESEQGNEPEGFNLE
ncbi:hypothetical protein EUZ85_19810 [Hahella sp. KA22]|uniref:hypothetical protein n=1 Tax=Hahella sp. KA22 TaxID=1628392 RepID=UPI000FDE3409|nr:hypothetical protein [Hahella sp. KA22]AZZ92850.1 hypothetical protein ENC22_17230 [Hahella sp. KA22]QAY56224.1 hypothetical protein EUZ85_19810 [Hahella sp. KA22]